MLSDLRIRKLKPGARDQWISDSEGLYLRMRVTGARSWVLRRKRGGHAEVITLGTWPTLSLAQARVKARALRGKSVSNETLGELIEAWYSDMVAKTYRRPADVAGYIERLDRGLKATKLRDLERLDVRKALRRYAEKRGPVAANRLLSLLKTALKFGVNAGYLEASPITGLTADLVGGSEETRARVLTDNEIRDLWHSASQHTPLLQFLLLTGQRIGEAQRATWAHVQGSRWNIPAEHSKNGRAHWIALSRQALELLGARDSARTLIFRTATDTGVQAWVRRWCEREKIAPAFTPHDLRRTCATRLADLGVMPHVIEKILNHTMQGVMAIYNRAEYETERTEAMQRWADELDRLASSTPQQR